MEYAWNAVFDSNDNTLIYTSEWDTENPYAVRSYCKAIFLRNTQNRHPITPCEGKIYMCDI